MNDIQPNKYSNVGYLYIQKTNVIALPTDAPAPHGTRQSAGTSMHIYIYIYIYSPRYRANLNFNNNSYNLFFPDVVEIDISRDVDKYTRDFSTNVFHQLSIVPGICISMNIYV